MEFCPIMSFGDIRPRPCEAGCAWRMPEPDAVYGNRVETARERGETKPERETYCAMAVVAESIRTGGQALSVELTSRLAEKAANSVRRGFVDHRRISQCPA